jgi:hypothetical protein
MLLIVFSSAPVINPTTKPTAPNDAPVTPLAQQKLTIAHENSHSLQGIGFQRLAQKTGDDSALTP